MTTHHTLSQIDYIQMLKLKIRTFLKHQKTTLVNQNFTFTGKQSSFIEQFKEKLNFFHNAKSIQINLVGKESFSQRCCNPCFYSCFQFCVVPFCCQCCKDYGHPAYVLEIKTFQIISEIIKNSPKVTSLFLNIVDNNLSKQKLDILSQGLQYSCITQFQLVNFALDSNYEGQEFNQFVKNCSSIKSLKLNVLNIMWSEHIIQNVNNLNVITNFQNAEQTPGRILIPTFQNELIKIQQKQIFNKKCLKQKIKNIKQDQKNFQKK